MLKLIFFSTRVSSVYVNGYSGKASAFGASFAPLVASLAVPTLTICVGRLFHSKVLDGQLLDHWNCRHGLDGPLALNTCNYAGISNHPFLLHEW